MALSPRVSDLFPYELLASVADTGSISLAARRHRLSQAAVSARMRTLEYRLQVRLLRRGARGTTLTPAGVGVLDRARRVVGAAAALDDHLAVLRAAPVPLRVAASSTVAEHLLPGWLADLRRSRPDVRIEMRATNSAEVVAAVRGGDADLGFVEDDRPPPDTDNRWAGGDELVVLVAPDHPWARRRAISPDELAGTALLVREAGSGTRTVLERRLLPRRAQGWSGSGTELTSSTAIKNAAARGLGVAVLSSLVAAGEVASGALCAVPVEGLDLRRDLHSIRLPARHHDAVDALLAIVAGRPATDGHGAPSTSSSTASRTRAAPAKAAGFGPE